MYKTFNADSQPKNNWGYQNDFYKNKQISNNISQDSNHQKKSYIRTKKFIEKDLQKAIETDELVLHYQPQMDVTYGKMIGYEALIRWHHPQHGILAPEYFIPLAEKTGLIVPLGAWVLKMVCSQTKTWYETGLVDCPVAVNVSPYQLQNNSFKKDLGKVLEKNRFSFRHLIIEITETMSSQDLNGIIKTLYFLKKMGINISLDDFGVGCLTIPCLNRLPISQIKIDKSLIQKIPSDSSDATIISSIISLAQGLGIKTIAEGVKTENQLVFLRKQGCYGIQSFTYSFPLSADDFVKFLDMENRRNGKKLLPN